MRRAFIFDLDGVLVDSEPLWETEKKKIYLKFFGKEIYRKMGSTLGINMDGIYDKAVQSGAQVDKAELVRTFYKSAEHIYKDAPLTTGLEAFGNVLKKLNYDIGIVSASPREWIDLVINRISFKSDIRSIISLHERLDLNHKPSPDGYIAAMRELDVNPEHTIVLEDSNAGIASAKAAGAYTIALIQNLVEGYKQGGADAYAKDLSEVSLLLSNSTFD